MLRRFVAIALSPFRPLTFTSPPTRVLTLKLSQPHGLCHRNRTYTRYHTMMHSTPPKHYHLPLYPLQAKIRHPTQTNVSAQTKLAQHHAHMRPHKAAHVTHARSLAHNARTYRMPRMHARTTHARRSKRHNMPRPHPCPHLAPTFASCPSLAAAADNDDDLEPVLVPVFFPPISASAP